MRFANPLSSGVLQRRYKRFLADVILDDGTAITAHCPNTGAMMGLPGAGAKVWLSRSANASRKYPYTLELIEDTNGYCIGINTGLPNALVAEALANRQIPELGHYTHYKPEVTYADSRFDFMLALTHTPRPCFIEVKNCHLCRTTGLLEFPDGITRRGTKHLHTLTTLAQNGHEAIMLYIGQRADIERFAVAADIDSVYAAAYQAARAAGVRIIAYACDVSPETITLAHPLAIT